MNCVESNDVGVDYLGVSHKCAKTAGISNIEEILSCYKGPDANSLEHEVALKTEALSPPHKWVPWVTVNDSYDEEVQN